MGKNKGEAEAPPVLFVLVLHIGLQILHGIENEESTVVFNNYYSIHWSLLLKLKVYKK